jgi:cation diffusion facilitator CzcD-associated flavoprotein CzcO
VAIIGGGFAGLVTGARLKAAGVEEVMRIIEGGGDVGGAWYWNRYPGAMCDTAAMIYLPLLEETGYMPSTSTCRPPRSTATPAASPRQFDLYDARCCPPRSPSLVWDDDASGRWIMTHRPGRPRSGARSSPWAPGRLHRPKLPGIPGIETFDGHAFHTSRWDYDYTGGDPAGAPMTGPGRQAGRHHRHRGHGGPVHPAPRHLGAELHVFQRTPSSVDVRNNHPIGPDWFAELGPGWQRSG